MKQNDVLYSDYLIELYSASKNAGAIIDIDYTELYNKALIRWKRKKQRKYNVKKILK